ncbi:MAG TPA: hypothetical protein VFJ43_18230 [Bacteroidia bacterium]|nr:hypothetical protein [Bacteroidia bacterium]
MKIKIKHLKAIIAVSLSICFFASCSIEKRVYRKGYHVDWNKTEDKTTPEAQPAPLKIPAKKIRMRTIISSVRKQEAKNIGIEKSFIKSIQKHEKKDTTYYTIKKKKGTASNPGGQASQGDEKKLNVAALVSFVLAIFVVLIVLLAITASSLFFLFLVIAGAILAAATGLIFAISGLRKIKANPGKYFNKWMALCGLIVPLIFLLGFILFFF